MAMSPHPLPTPPLSIPTPDEVYRPQFVQNLFNAPGSTPGSDGASIGVPVTDPAFSTDEYEVTDVVQRSARKGKAPAVDTSGSEKPKRPRSTYSEAESQLIAQCWADTTQDAAIANNQTEIQFWERVREKYTAYKQPGMKDHSGEQIRRHWERLMKECGQFNCIYSNLLNQMSSGETEQSVRKEANTRYAARYNNNGFKWWDIYEILKDLPKFRRGMNKAQQPRSVRTRLSTDGSYSSGPEAIDLSDDRPPPERPMGNRKTKDLKKGKGKGKGKAGSCPAETEGKDATVIGSGKVLAHLYTLYLTTKMSKKNKEKLWKTMNGLKKKMGIIEKSDSEADNDDEDTDDDE